MMHGSVPLERLQVAALAASNLAQGVVCDTWLAPAGQPGRPRKPAGPAYKSLVSLWWRRKLPQWRLLFALIDPGLYR